MNELDKNTNLRGAIDASWARCERDYKLSRSTARPILRLQSTEVAPRLDELIERTGGRHGVFRQLAELAIHAGRCFVITDADGILVRLENYSAEPDWNGIALGSVWDERVAGTNGVSMALNTGGDVTVRGKDHFFSQLQPFACSGVPLRDAQNAIIGVASLTSIDRGAPTDGLFAEQLLSAAAARIQQTLFERRFEDQAIVSVAVPGQRNLIKGPELVAVDEQGVILGSTTSAHKIVGNADHSKLVGKRFDDAFGTDMSSLDKGPGRVVSVRGDQGAVLDLWCRAPMRKSRPFPGMPAPPKPRRQLQPSMQDVAHSSGVMRAMCEQVQRSVDHGLPVLIEGETGTGKTTLIKALMGDQFQTVTVACATLEDTSENRFYIRSLMEQASIAQVLNGQAVQCSALVFDNIDEMPPFAQAILRDVLDGLPDRMYDGQSGVQVIATSRRSLQTAVSEGRFRDDLYFMLSSGAVQLPALRAREGLHVLAQSMANHLAGRDVTFSPEAVETIETELWPGNVRELKGALQQALLGGDGSRITQLDLRRGQTTMPDARRALVPPTDYSEEQLLMDALNGAQWNISKAARTLGIGRATIHRKMKLLGISRPN